MFEGNLPRSLVWQEWNLVDEAEEPVSSSAARARTLLDTGVYDYKMLFLDFTSS